MFQVPLNEVRLSFLLVFVFAFALAESLAGYFNLFLFGTIFNFHHIFTHHHSRQILQLLLMLI